MQTFKIVLLAILSVLVLIVILQNTETVDTRVLFLTLSMPRAALLFGTFIVGFVVGLLTAGRLRASGSKETE